MWNKTKTIKLPSFTASYVVCAIYRVYQRKLEDFKMSEKLLFHQNISKIHLRLSISASSGLSNGKEGQKNERRKAGGRFAKASFLTACAKKMSGSKSKFI